MPFGGFYKRSESLLRAHHCCDVRMRLYRVVRLMRVMAAIGRTGPARYLPAISAIINAALIIYIQTKGTVTVLVPQLNIAWLRLPYPRGTERGAGAQKQCDGCRNDRLRVPNDAPHRCNAQTRVRTTKPKQKHVCISVQVVTFIGQTARTHLHLTANATALTPYLT